MEDVVLAPGATRDVPINARVELPRGYWASIEARSSIVRRGLQVDAGIIDEGYRGQLFAVTRNVGQSVVRINALERVAQLVFHKLHDLWCVEVAQIDVDGTSRAQAGFGSTGA